jgi:hypothetical protein
MLLNLVLALRGQGDDSRAAEASRAALGLKQDSSQLCHGVWLALDDALAGDPAEAGQRLKDANWTGCDATHRFLHALVEALVSVQLVPAAERHRLFAETRTKLRQAAIDCSPLREDRPAVRQAYRRALRRLARDFGGKKARLWSLWRCWRPILPAS